jgi:hypothetical protein
MTPVCCSLNGWTGAVDESHAKEVEEHSVRLQHTCHDLRVTNHRLNLSKLQGVRIGVQATLANRENPLNIPMVRFQQSIVTRPLGQHFLNGRTRLRSRRQAILIEEKVVS